MDVTTATTIQSFHENAEQRLEVQSKRHFARLLNRIVQLLSCGHDRAAASMLSRLAGARLRHIYAHQACSLKQRLGFILHMFESRYDDEYDGHEHDFEWAYCDLLHMQRQAALQSSVAALMLAKRLVSCSKCEPDMLGTLVHPALVQCMSAALNGAPLLTIEHNHRLLPICHFPCIGDTKQ